MTQNKAVIALQWYEIPRYFVWPIDFLLPFFQIGNNLQRKQNRKLLINVFKGDTNSRYLLGREVYRYYKDDNFWINQQIHLWFAKRLLYKVHRIGGPNGLQASTLCGSISYKQNNVNAAIFFWNSAAERGGASAMYHLGNYEKVNHNRADAIYWLERAAGLGHSKSKIMLNKMLQAPAPNQNLNPRSAELHVEEWMAHWGFLDARATPVGPDGGFDVVSTRAAAQVKFRNQPSTLDQINSFHGACNGNYEFEIFVSRSGFTEPARIAADRYGMALFEFAQDGTPRPVNAAADSIFRE